MYEWTVSERCECPECGASASDYWNHKLIDNEGNSLPWSVLVELECENCRHEFETCFTVATIGKEIKDE
jgi:hypothetical protein